MRGRWRGGHAATDEVDVGYTLHDRRCGRCRSPSPAAACVIPCFQFSMLLHNLSSIFLSVRKPASAPCAAPASRTARPPQRASQKRPPHPHRPKAPAGPHPTKSARQTAPGRKPTPHPHIPLSALPHAPPRPAAARTGVCPTASTPSRTAPVHRCAPAGPRPAESTHQAARRAAPARTGLSALKRVLHTLSTEFSTFSPVSHSGFLSPWLSLRETG